MKNISVLLLLALLAIAWPIEAQSPKTAVPVSLIKTDVGYQLLRGGQPYFIKGVGGDGSRQLLAQAGGNSIRTWGADKLEKTLDEAEKLGLTVTVGIWLGHERHGFNYNNADQVAEQVDKVRQAILRYKDHPAVLMWGLGNEMEGYDKGDNAAIWSAINNLAALAKKIDPKHPTMTVIAEIGGDRVKNIHRLCPDIDVIGINCYAGLASLPKRYPEAGGTKPYVVTEFGPPGVWEVKKNGWGAAPELTSTEKAEIYRKNYQLGIAGPKDICLGSYAFLWGNKQEATATWFGMFLPNGARLGAIDAMTEAWSGKPPAHRCPVIASLKQAGLDQVEPGATVTAELQASAPDGGSLKVRWVLAADHAIYGVGGDAEEAPPTYPDAIVKSDAHSATVKMPKGGGGYRLYAYIEDNHGGGAAVGNIPLFVKGPVILVKAKAAKLPLVVYDEADRTGLPYAPSGWMGNAKAVKANERCEENPHQGKTCLRFDYQAKDGWTGVVWQHPPGDWSDRPGGWDLSGASKLSFWARGAKGGETVTFEFGIYGKDKKYGDTAKGKLENVKLTAEWRRYQFDLRGMDLSRIRTGFGWVIQGSGQPMTFYLDDIVFE